MTATTINSFPSMHNWRSPRGWALAIIVLLHVGFFWTLSSGLTPQMIKQFISEPPVFIPIPEQPTPPKQVEIKDVDIEPMPIPTSVRPEIPIPNDTFNERTTIIAPEPTAPNDFGAGDVVEPAPPIRIVEPRIDARRGLSQPLYPPQMIREGAEGTVLLSIYVLADGRVGEVKLDRSSGHTKLDESAMREARRWRFVPGTSDGQPTAMWKQVPVTFRLNTRM
ncbi:MAG TPA: TonB family protein [Steroidobacter sp.]|uniref:energy transducer TonB n=1 Tax=Steroidobacter sp. TaxID=1978227 RepID=UPI002ED95CF1